MTPLSRCLLIDGKMGSCKLKVICLLSWNSLHLQLKILKMRLLMGEYHGK